MQRHFFTTVSAVRVFVTSFPPALRFYREVLGLRLATLHVELPEYAIFKTGDASLIVELVDSDDEQEAQLCGRFTGVSLATPDIYDAYDHLHERGVAFLHPPERQTWGGILAHFRDPSGNVLTMVQYEDPAA
jgi:predicted enzyme related to lactoylglutathione lyase